MPFMGACCARGDPSERRRKPADRCEIDVHPHDLCSDTCFALRILVLTLRWFVFTMQTSGGETQDQKGF